MVYSQYREQGAHMWRGFSIEEIINQCIGNVMDGGKGRQMPVHYGSKKYNNVTVSSPLSRSYVIQPPKFPKLQVQVMLSDRPNKKEYLPATSDKERLVREILQLLLILRLL